MIRASDRDTGGAAGLVLGQHLFERVEAMFELGMMHASGREVPVDLITAHKWFNIAAMNGHAEAAQLRREVAAEMTDAEIRSDLATLEALWREKLDPALLY